MRHLAHTFLTPHARHRALQNLQAFLAEAAIPSPCPSKTKKHLFSTSSPSTSSPNGQTPFHLLDRVFVKGMPFFARHGVHRAEAELGQRFLVDAEVFLRGLGQSVLAEEGRGTSSPSAPPPDDVSRTIDYGRIYDVARGVVQDGPRAQLVETLATRIADALLRENGSSHSPPFSVVGARVKVTKPGAPIEGVFGEAGCEVVRWRE